MQILNVLMKYNMQNNRTCYFIFLNTISEQFWIQLTLLLPFPRINYRDTSLECIRKQFVGSKVNFFFALEFFFSLPLSLTIVHKKNCIFYSIKMNNTLKKPFLLIFAILPNYRVYILNIQSDLYGSAPKVSNIYNKNFNRTLPVACIT